MALPPFTTNTLDQGPFDMGGGGTAFGDEPMGAEPPASLMLPPPPAGNFGIAAATTPPREETQALDKLKPGSTLHTEVLRKLMAMLNFSTDKVKPAFARFRNQEMKVQAYMQSQDYDRLVTTVEQSKGAEIPEPVQVVVPYTYATLHAAATFISSVLIGRRPVFPLAAVRGSNVDNARFMEAAITSNLQAVSGQEKLFQHNWDGLLYGFSPLKIGWETRRGKKMSMGMGDQRQFTDSVIFEGNSLNTVDPYKFRPDPRVPMHEVAVRGDFCFDLVETSETTLRDKEERGEYKWVKEGIRRARTVIRSSTDERRSHSRQSINLNPKDVVGFIEVAEGTVRLVPKDWGLGDSKESELWHFVFVPDGQIISAKPFENIHGRHPYPVGEPTTLGYDFMSMSMSEFISVFQDMLSWLVSSRMENVRASIANSYVVDPARVEMNDIKSSAIGRVIRMKQESMGLPVREAIMQLSVNDVTGGHFTDISVLRQLADAATGVNDNLRGIQNQGRRSATEARMSMQAGASRLSQLATRLSGQSYNGLADQMISNIQQFISPEFWIELSGDDSENMGQNGINDLVGSFAYQISDGSLPLDKGAMVETWKEILMGVAQDPELRQNWDINEIFEHIAELGGAKNIQAFRRQQQPQIAAPGETPPGEPVPGRPAPPPMPASLAFT